MTRPAVVLIIEDGHPRVRRYEATELSAAELLEIHSEELRESAAAHVKVEVILDA